MSYHKAQHVDRAVPFSLRLVPRLAFPAVAALALTGAISAAAVTRRLHPGPAFFQKRAEAATAAGQTREAALWLRRQIEENPAAREPRMKLLEIYLSLNQTQPAIDLFSELAPGDSVVYGPAHLRRAQLILANGASGNAGAQAKICLQHALAADPAKGQGTVDTNLAKALMAEVLAAEGNWTEVLATAQSITAPSSATQLLLAKAMKNLGRQEEAQATASKVATQVSSDPQTGTPEDQLRRATSLAEAALLQGDLDGAVKIALAAGATPPFKQLQASVYTRAALSCRSGKTLDSAHWLELIASGLGYQPENLGLTLELLQGLERFDREPGFRSRVSQRIEASGLLAHQQLLSALANLQQKRPQLAFDEFKKAWELLPANPIIANNYAGILALQRAPGIASQALPIIDAVLKNYPNAPTFLDTKGQVLLGMGQAKEAVAVLEAALRGAPMASTHLVLAEAYAQIGSPVLAQSHRQRAAALQQQLTQNLPEKSAEVPSAAPPPAPPAQGTEPTPKR